MTNYLVKSTANYLLCVVLNSGECITKHISYPHTVHFILEILKLLKLEENVYICVSTLDTFNQTLKTNNAKRNVAKQ